MSGKEEPRRKHRPGPKPGPRSRTRTSRTKAWTSMRILKSFTVPQIVATSGISVGSAQRYIRQMELAGYVRKEREREKFQPGSHAVYRLIRDTGPLAPAPWGFLGRAFDHNTQEVYPPPAGEEPGEEGE